MTTKQKKLVENYIRLKVSSMLKETKKRLNEDVFNPSLLDDKFQNEFDPEYPPLISISSHSIPMNKYKTVSGTLKKKITFLQL